VKLLVFLQGRDDVKAAACPECWLRLVDIYYRFDSVLGTVTNRTRRSSGPRRVEHVVV
jgi:hypothetical protein